MHPLLARQLRKAFPAGTPGSTELELFIASVEAAYWHADDEREQLERSLVLASDELFERNRKLEADIAERKRLLIELQHAEKMRAIGLLSAGVAHEINTPIQFIADSLGFLEDAFAELAAALDAGSAAEIDAAEIAYLRGEVPRALERCTTGATRVATIVGALQGFSRSTPDQHAPADLRAAISNTLVVASNRLKHAAEIELSLEATRSPVCDIGEIQQVFLNLVLNGADAIVERTGPLGKRGTLRIATRDDGDDVVVTVADDGAGIPEAIRPRLFEPFFTTKPMGQGTGQGLALAFSIVERHGGRLSFESVLGRGTTFTVRLPALGRPAGALTAAR